MFVFVSLLTGLDGVKSFECSCLYVQVALSSPLLSHCSLVALASTTDSSAVIVAIITAKVTSILENIGRLISTDVIRYILLGAIITLFLSILIRCCFYRR